MVKIVADTSTLFSSEEGNKHGITITPLSVNIAKDSYRELDEITSAQFLERLQGGALPTSSQPSIGEKMEQYELLAKADEVLDITMADGLSGTYESACNAKADCVYGDRITVLNSETLCGPHRYLALKAVRLAEQGNSEPISGPESSSAGRTGEFRFDDRGCPSQFHDAGTIVSHPA